MPCVSARKSPVFLLRWPYHPERALHFVTCWAQGDSLAVRFPVNMGCDVGRWARAGLTLTPGVSPTGS